MLVFTFSIIQEVKKSDEENKVVKETNAIYISNFSDSYDIFQSTTCNSYVKTIVE